MQYCIVSRVSETGEGNANHCMTVKLVRKMAKSVWLRRETERLGVWGLLAIAELQSPPGTIAKRLTLEFLAN